MGLEISLKVIKHGIEIDGEHSLSRCFAWTLEKIYDIYLAREQFEKAAIEPLQNDTEVSYFYKDYSSEIIQLFEMFKIDYQPLLESIEWDWLASYNNGIIPQKINNYNPHSVNQIYFLFKDLRDNIAKKPESVQSIDYTLDYLDDYFNRKIQWLDFNSKPIPSPYLEKDLDVILHFLEKYIHDHENKAYFYFL